MYKYFFSIFFLPKALNKLGRQSALCVLLSPRVNVIYLMREAARRKKNIFYSERETQTPSALNHSTGDIRIARALTRLLHVTCTRYLVSGHSDSSAELASVSRLPTSPPPATSHVTKQLRSDLDGFQARFVATRNSCLTIDAMCTGQSGGGGWFLMRSHSRQH